jgi:hypothetical protein
MRRLPCQSLFLTAFLLAPIAAWAGEIVIGLGADDVTRSASPAGLIEIRSDPVWEHRGFGRPVTLALAAAGEIDADGDLWTGVGAILGVAVHPRWRLDLGFLPGVYSRGTFGTDLGATAPIFRTSIGVSVAVTPHWRAGAMLSHKSNADTARENPGVETLHLTLARRF